MVWVTPLTATLQVFSKMPPDVRFVEIASFFLLSLV